MSSFNATDGVELVGVAWRHDCKVDALVSDRWQAGAKGTIWYDDTVVLRVPEKETSECRRMALCRWRGS